MPAPSFSSITGDTQQQMLDSLEKFRKELWWLLQSLDSTNVKELNAEVINAGRIAAKYLKVGHETEFEEGYDTRSLFEVTNDRITAEVESINGNIASLEITADQIRSEVSAQITNINGQITVIQDNVSTVTQTASQIQSTVSSQQTQINSQGIRITDAESNINQQAWQITQKVSQTDYNGNRIASLINQTATDITIQANRINLNGAVLANGKIEGSTSITVGTNLFVGSNIFMQGSGGGNISFPASRANIWSDSSGIGISTQGRVMFDAYSIDFGHAFITGLDVEASNVGGYTMYHTTSSGKRYMHFRHYGSYLGNVELLN